MAHTHSIYDSDSHFSINPITRQIKNESSAKVIIMQYDHNSERFTFEMPREIEGHDMSLCNRVEVHFQNGTHADVYTADDLQISPDGDDVVICSWLISRNATQYVGALTFKLRFACIGENSAIDYEWNTAIFKGISIGEGMNNGEAITEQYPDALEQLKQEIIEEIPFAEEVSV